MTKHTPGRCKCGETDCHKAGRAGHYVPSQPVPISQEIRFMKHYVTDGTLKARIHYSASAIISGQKCVTLYAKSHDDGPKLAAIFPGTYKNDTDMMTDYFETGLARILEGDALYPAALSRCHE